MLCCCGGEKRDLYADAVAAKEKELDVVHIAQAWRTTRFLCEIQPDPAFCRLIKYASDYRVQPIDTDSNPLPNPANPDDQHNLDVRLAGTLNNNTRLHQTLIHRITGAKGTKMKGINMSSSNSEDNRQGLLSN